MIDLQDIRLLAFDADDTLWDCQSHFDRVEKEYCRVLADYAPADAVSRTLFSTETANMPLLGYGCKAFTISLVENAVRISCGKLTAAQTMRIIELGKSLLQLPGTPLRGVEQTLQLLRGVGRWVMVVFTKGEILDQQNKLRRSGLARYFDDVIVVADKTRDEYLRMCRRFGVAPKELLMIGDSFRSDIEPVLQLGGSAVHIPFHTVWQHEVVEEHAHDRLVRLESFSQLSQLLPMQ